MTTAATLIAPRSADHFATVQAPWRTLRQLTVATVRERAARRAVSRALRALDRATVDPRPLVLERFHELAEGRELLESLDGRHGLRVVLRGRPSSFLEHAALLAHLDRDHAIELALEPSLDGETWLSAVRDLASLGLSIRLVLPRGAAGRRLRPLLDAARSAGVDDVEWADGASAASVERLARLRSASGFPRRSPVRG